MKLKDNFSNFLSLREKYPRFIYESYHVDFKDNHLNISFKFHITENITFLHVITVPWKKNYFHQWDMLSGNFLDTIIFHLGMIELVSYWKTTCSPVLILPKGKLSKTQAAFWKKLYFNGLGEFFFMNGIQTDMDSFMTIEGLEDHAQLPADIELGGPPIVPVGGGKDSAVTLGLLENSDFDWIPFAINPIEASVDIIKAAGRKEEEIIRIERRIDPLLLQMNREGYLNGHTPFSALVAFYGVLVAWLAGSSDILLSNESSANEATIPGTSINHQYSKTIEFERDFRNYVRAYLSPSLNYFSLLRPLTELQIAEMFSGFPKFFNLFRSCNVGSKTGEWCCKCPKCLFTWIILSPFLSQEKLNEIFGVNLLDDPDLQDTLDELCGISPVKPFECIGTIDEVNESLNWLVTHHPGKELPFLLRYYSARVKPGTYGASSFENRLKTLNRDHFVPEKYLQLLEYDRKA